MSTSAREVAHINSFTGGCGHPSLRIIDIIRHFAIIGLFFTLFPLRVRDFQIAKLSFVLANGFMLLIKYSGRMRLEYTYKVRFFI